MQRKDLLVQIEPGVEIPFTNVVSPLVTMDRNIQSFYLPYRYGVTHGRLIAPRIEGVLRPLAIVERNPYPQFPNEYSSKFPKIFLKKMWQMKPPTIYADSQGISAAIIYPSETDAMLKLDGHEEASKLRSLSFVLKQKQYYELLLSFIFQINPSLR